MDGGLRYTEEELAVIDGILGLLYSRVSSSALKDEFFSIHEHIQRGIVEPSDLRRIKSALEFSDPGQCTSSNKESYRNMTILLVKTNAMLRASV